MTKQEMLQQAEAAFHSLQTGKMAVSVQKGDRKVEFSRANIHELRSYIDDLRAQLGLSSVRRRGPAGVLF
ncbi:phage tail protein [Vibrio parahaemolyticus]|uniref:gpW family head-tail joining protein n=1 Tax=Vibrio parahaemolyticus TaxID=670 RepID=UPI001A181ACF|nr:gpW family head-tail joining protein [Vibrio parahaemolyticus]EGQ7686746.1 phage tail protein [Vibrio parahaemolyticus]EGQ8184689.1 phage tail protein [Vibrio parahaemolyticus]EGQ8544986.1 phage tail protein [Vibrio parahaemolyticus]EKQ5824411.1 gpW family protein [Vibrio parahaemolyticus]